MMKRIFYFLFATAVLCAPVSSSAWLIQGGAADTGRQLFASGSPALVSGAADKWIPFGSSGTAQNSAFKSFIFTVAGTIKSLKLNMSVVPAAGKTWAATVYLNGSSTAATATFDSTGAIADWTGSVSTSPGDVAVIFLHPVGSPSSSAPQLTVGWTPTTTNDTVIATGADGGTFSTSATNFLQPFSSTSPGTGSSRTNGVFPDGGTIDKLYVSSVAPGTAASGKKYDYTPPVNLGATTITAQILETATSANDTTHSTAVSAGNFLNFQAVPTSTPTASDAAIGVRFVPSTTGAFPYINGNQALSPSNSVATFVNITGGDSVVLASESLVQTPARSQTITKLQVKVQTAPGAGGSGKKFTYAVRVNGVDSALTCDILNTATTCSATGSVTVNDNDLLDLSITPANTPTANSIGFGILAAR